MDKINDGDDDNEALEDKINKTVTRRRRRRRQTEKRNKNVHSSYTEQEGDEEGN